MPLAINLDVLLATIDELSTRAGSSRAGFLLDHGLRFHDTLERWTYSSTPMNSVTFASTGGDGVHFGLLRSASISASDGPVIMTVPTASRANHIIAGSINEFLGLGCARGWFSLEQLAYSPEDAFDLYARPESPTADRIFQLFDRLALMPLALQPDRLEALAQLYAGSIELRAAKSPRSPPVDLEAFLAWKRSTYGEQ
jgi:hypothetical protein